MNGYPVDNSATGIYPQTFHNLDSRRTQCCVNYKLLFIKVFIGLSRRFEYLNSNYRKIDY